MIESNHYTQEFYESQQAGSRSSAQVVLPLIKKIFNPASVIDVGCGVAHWLSVWQNELGISEIQGVEGPYVQPSMLTVDPAHVIFQDLKAPLKINRRYDIVMSLEVAEHLPNELSKQFVSTLTSLGDVVLFSAAIPGQEGTYHINEQMPEFWASLFIDAGFVPVDYLRPKIWGNKEVEWWYQQNIILYIKKEKLDGYPELQDSYKNTDPKYLFRVHPWLFNYHYSHKVKTSTWIGYARWKLYPVKKLLLGQKRKK